MTPRRHSPALTAYRAGAAAAAVLPAPVGRGLAEGVGVVASRASFALEGMRRRRALMARHLCRVYGDSVGPAQLSRRVDEAFASYGRYWADSLRLPSLSPGQIEAGITYDGYELIQAGEAAGRGTILALPHVGGWEWAGAHLASAGHSISVVVESLDPPEVYEWFVAFRQRLGMRVIPVGPGATAACQQALADNHLLCLLCDRLVRGTAGIEVEFFGERTLLPAGPVMLALRTGAALLPCAVYFGKQSDRHLAVVRPPLAPTRGGRLRHDVQAGTQVLTRELELLIRRAPTQWHLMQPNWPSDDNLTPPGSDPSRVEPGSLPPCG